MEYLFVGLKGFITAAGLIIAIGAQNAYVLTQGIKGRYCTSIALTCAGLDAILIIAGVMGMGVLIQSNPAILYWVTLLGALFLTGYGFRALYSVIYPSAMRESNDTVQTRKAALLTCLALSLLNPHVYLDTVILIGSIGGALPKTQQLYYVIGACIASLTWFMSLSHGARYLSPYLSTKKAWQILDGLVSLMMFGIAMSLWQQFVNLSFK